MREERLSGERAGRALFVARCRTGGGERPRRRGGGPGRGPLRAVPFSPLYRGTLVENVLLHRGGVCLFPNRRAQGERGLRRPPPQKSNGRGVLGRCHSICRIPHNHRAAGQNAPAPGRGAREEARWLSRHRGRGQWAGQRRGDGGRRRAGSRAFQPSIGALRPLPMQRRGAEQSWAAGRGSFRAVRPSGSADFQLLPLPPGLSPAPGQEGEGNWAIGGSKFPLVPPPGGFPSSPLREVCGSHAPLPRQGWRAKGVGDGRQGEGPSRPRSPSSSADFQRPYPKSSAQCRNGGEDETGWQAIERANFQAFPPWPFPQHWGGKPSGAFARVESRAGRAPRQRRSEKPVRPPTSRRTAICFQRRGRKGHPGPGQTAGGLSGEDSTAAARRRTAPPIPPPAPIDRVVSAGYDGGREGGSPCRSGKSRWATGRTTPSAKV